MIKGLARRLWRSGPAAAPTPREPPALVIEHDPTPPAVASTPRRAKPARRRTVSAPPKPVGRCRRYSHTAAEHARRLHDWVFSPGGPVGEVRSPEMQRIYREMCVVIGWDERPWNPVAAEFTRMTTGRKVYRYFGPSRLRVYPVRPEPTPAEVRGDSVAPDTSRYRTISDARRAA